MNCTHSLYTRIWVRSWDPYGQFPRDNNIPGSRHPEVLGSRLREHYRKMAHNVSCNSRCALMARDN